MFGRKKKPEPKIVAPTVSNNLTKNDQKWGELNRELEQSAVARKWGFVRNCYLGMAQVLEKEKNHRQAVLQYLIVSLYDANGPHNWPGGDPISPEMAAEFGIVDFDGKNEVLPGITGRLLNQADKAGMSIEDIKELYFLEAPRFHLAIMPHSVEECWERIAAAL
ncbi:MAG TPA: hypothetical protein PK417_01950 [Hyphomonas sp.]|nr:hypothetical protein [Hyphomonas sp.]